MSSDSSRVERATHRFADGRKISLSIALDEIGLPQDDLCLPDGLFVSLDQQWDTYVSTILADQAAPLPERPIPPKPIQRPTREERPDSRLYEWMDDWDPSEPIAWISGAWSLVTTLGCAFFVGFFSILILSEGEYFYPRGVDSLAIFGLMIFGMVANPLWWVTVLDARERNTRWWSTIPLVLTGGGFLVASLVDVWRSVEAETSWRALDLSDGWMNLIAGAVVLFLLLLPTSVFSRIRRLVTGRWEARRHRRETANHQDAIARYDEARTQWVQEQRQSPEALKTFLEDPKGAAQIWQRAQGQWDQRKTEITEAIAEGEVHRRRPGTDPAIVAAIEEALAALLQERATIQSAEDELARAKVALKVVADHIQSHITRVQEQEEVHEWLQEQQSNHEQASVALERTRLELAAAVHWFERQLRDQHALALARDELAAHDRRARVAQPDEARLQERKAQLEVAAHVLKNR